MTQIQMIACLVLAALIFGSGYEVRGWKDGQADAKHDLAQQQLTIVAEQHVIEQTKSQNTINQGAEKAYEKDIDTIAGLYDPSVQPAPIAASSGVRRVPATACGAQTSKRYKLTPQQCDTEEARCIQLYDAWKAQAAVK